MSEQTNIASFVKYQRKMHRLTQEQLAEKAGVGLRFIRDLEQGKETLRLDKVNQVVALFGHRMVAFTEKQLDPYDILWNHYDRNVDLLLKDKTTLEGCITGKVMRENQIIAWNFVPYHHVAEFERTQNPELVQTINHHEIDSIHNR